MTAMLSSLFSIVLCVFVNILCYKKISLTKKEGILLILISSAIIIESIFEPFLFEFDGKEEAYWFLKLCNGFQYLLLQLLTYLWVLFMFEHMNKKINTLKTIVLGIPLFIGCVFMFINNFVPLIYKIDQTGTYVRLSGYYYYFLSDIVYLLCSIIIYLISKRNDITLVLFPMYIFILPILIGSIFQTIYSLVSAVIPFCSIAYASLLISLQSENNYKDTLTGIYNRALLNFYLSRIKQDLMIVLIDLNDFKSINDTYGHDTGDSALKLFATILNETVSNDGYTIRYAGDEFMIIFKSLDEEKNINKIKLTQDKLKNASKKLRYEISFSYGYGIYSYKEPFNEFLSIIDKMMYDNKREYHKSKND